jgi:signal transduction histidine kinase
VIQGFSEALLNGEVGTIDDTAREYLGRVVANTQRMGQLIHDILRLSRVAREPLDCADFDMMALARETMASVQARHPGRQVGFEAPGNHPVRADRRLIGIVLDNLFDNALKFSARQPVSQIRFEARATPHGGAAFEVCDNGVGFPAPWRDPGFGSFQRLHSGPEFPGNGIGLATVARIVRRHGGRLVAVGAPEGGAVFRFTLATPPHTIERPPHMSPSQR